MKRINWNLIRFIIWVVAIAACFFYSPPARLEDAPIRILIIDTGIKVQADLKLCPTGHYDFIQNKPVIGYDWKIHGDNVAHTISREIKPNINYCLVIYKYYAVRDAVGNQHRMDQALSMATHHSFQYVNISSSGEGRDTVEHNSIETLFDNGTKIFVAAGNSHIDLDDKCNIYPICYHGFVEGVGALDFNGKREHYSNFGKAVTIWEDGNYYDVDGYKVGEGTSYAAPRALAKDVNKVYGK